MRRPDLILVLVALPAAVLFFVGLDRLWPLVGGRLIRDDARIAAEAGPLLERLGMPADGRVLASRLRVDESALDYAEAAFGRERTRALLADGCPLLTHRAIVRRPGAPDSVQLAWLPAGRIVGWDRGVQEDAPGAILDAVEAEQLARNDLVRLGAGDVERTEAAQIERPSRRDHRFAFTRWRERAPELRERWEVVVAGDRVVKAWPTVVVPAEALRAQRAAAAPVQLLQTVGWAGLGAFILIALVIALRRLARGEVRLGRALALAGLAAALMWSAQALQTTRLVEQWDPLWPRWVAALRTLSFDAIDALVAALPVLAFVAAGGALDARRTLLPGQRSRGDSLWLLLRGHVADPTVAAASARGFLVGALCGAALLATVLLLDWCTGARTDLQPRGFFLSPLGSAAPALGALLFFACIALVEETGYRFFAGTWLESVTGSRLAAIALPAVIYGLMHSDMSFLPPATPSWGRPLALAVVGAVWGWAFFRYDALTVILSHLTADLFIFTWPQLASGTAGERAAAVAVMLVPLLPAALGGLRLLDRRAQAGSTGSAPH